MSDQTKPAVAEAAPAPKLRDPAAYVVTDMRDELMWMSDDGQLAALIRGERRPISERKFARAKPGDTVKGLPAMSVKGLLEDGWIVKPGQPWQINPAKAAPIESEASA